MDTTMPSTDPVTQIEESLHISNVSQLIAVTPSQWTSFFTTGNNSNYLPSFTAPGTPEQRISAFLGRPTKFFTLPADTTGSNTAGGGTISNLGTIPGDPLSEFISAYNSLGTPFDFAQQQDLNRFNTALEAVFPSNEDYREWLKRAINTVLELYTVTNIRTSTPIPPSYQFSLMEAL